MRDWESWDEGSSSFHPSGRRSARARVAPVRLDIGVLGGRLSYDAAAVTMSSPDVTVVEEKDVERNKDENISGEEETEEDSSAGEEEEKKEKMSEIRRSKRVRLNADQAANSDESDGKAAEESNNEKKEEEEISIRVGFNRTNEVQKEEEEGAPNVIPVTLMSSSSPPLQERLEDPSSATKPLSSSSSLPTSTDPLPPNPQDYQRIKKRNRALLNDYSTMNSFLLTSSAQNLNNSKEVNTDCRGVILSSLPESKWVNQLVSRSAVLGTSSSSILGRVQNVDGSGKAFVRTLNGFLRCPASTLYTVPETSSLRKEYQKKEEERSLPVTQSSEASSSALRKKDPLLLPHFRGDAVSSLERDDGIILYFCR